MKTLLKLSAAAAALCVAAAVPAQSNAPKAASPDAYFEFMGLLALVVVEARSAYFGGSHLIEVQLQILEHLDRRGAPGAIHTAARMQERTDQVQTLDSGHRQLGIVGRRPVTGDLIKVGRHTVYVAARHAVGHIAGMIKRRHHRALDDVVAAEILHEFAVI